MVPRTSVTELAAHLQRSFSGKVGLGVPEEERVSSGDKLRTGSPEIDRAFGGLPRGRISEFVGPGSSGKLSLLLSLLREVIAPSVTPRRPEGTSGLAALVDLSGTIFPGEAWAVGRLLVVRPRTLSDALRSLDILVSSGTLDVVAFETAGAGLSGSEIPEAVIVRLSRLARETGTALVACACRSLFGSATSLRLVLEPDSAGGVVVRAAKNRQGALGSVPLPRPDSRGRRLKSSLASVAASRFLRACDPDHSVRLSSPSHG